MPITFALLDEVQLAEARRLLQDAPWADGKDSAGTQAALAKNNAQLPPDGEAARALQSLLTGALERSPRFLASALPRKLFPPQFNRYAGLLNA